MTIVKINDLMVSDHDYDKLERARLSKAKADAFYNDAANVPATRRGEKWWSEFNMLEATAQRDAYWALSGLTDDIMFKAEYEVLKEFTTEGEES